MKSAVDRIQVMVEEYKLAHSELLDGNPDFRKWLENEYVPIVGGWQY
jgi:hypothetical protein